MNKIVCAFVFATLTGTALAETGGHLDPAKPPGQNFDLSGYKLQLPVADGNSIAEIPPDKLAGYTSRYFQTDPSSGGMAFYCPDNGATSRGSHYPRTELRNLSNWHFSGEHTLSATLAVTQQPGSGDIIVGQIHGDGTGSEALKLRWVKGAIVVGVKTSHGAAEQKYTIAQGLKLGDRLTYRIAQNGHQVSVTVNGATQRFTYDSSWDGESVYFKAGNYLQDDSSSGSAGVVVFFALR